MKKDEVQHIRFPHIDTKSLDEVVRVIKYGIHYSTVISEDVKALLEKWVREMEAEIHAAEHHGEANPFLEEFQGADLGKIEPDDGEPV